MLCQRLWDCQKTDLVDPVQKNEQFEVFIGVYLARIDNAFSEMHETSRRDSVISVDSIEAITFEGISNRYRRFSSPTVLSGRGFGDLPTETAWKIFRYLEPVYLSVDLIAVQNYFKEVSSDPVRLDKLLRALRAHGPSVRVVVIDDIDIGPVHIRTCSRYIDQCLSLCPSVHHVQCNGDIGLDTSRMHTLPSLALVLPRWLPVDIPAAFRFAGPELKRFGISEWNLLGKEENTVLIPSTLPQLEAFSITDSNLSPGLLSRLLYSITKEGRNVLRELSFAGISALDGPNILQLLEINTLSAHITILRIRLHRVTTYVDNDNSIQSILGVCPCLIEFSYTSPSSSEIFTHLPQTLRTLELAAIFSYPFLPPVISGKMVPRITTVDPFVRYLRSPTSKNIRRLSIIRQVLQWDRMTGQLWRRLGAQTWDWEGELQGL
ncbi:hypothetical protein BDZ94DRAFT_107899 [Collybia nuda]|uniref:F-box domain-containing protein n=1 Tax=Collybia nuda TaxID=64659 RepID=A0A9P5XWK5_9AGAR|nr:hypothetical protein BDZ94DRAFT_107899 [Collybia nuda]